MRAIRPCLSGWLDRTAQRVDLKATGVYERAVMARLLEAGREVVRLNLRHARASATAMGKLANTDPIDAAVLLTWLR